MSDLRRSQAIALAFALASLWLLGLPGCGYKARRVAGDGDGGLGRARIVCLTPSSTELVAALGATDLIVGVDKYSSYPAEVRHLPKVGDFLSPDLETILALTPDIAVLDAVQTSVAAKLEHAGIKTVSLEMHTVADVRGGLATLGRALDREREAEQAIARLDEAISTTRAAADARAKAAAARPRVLFVVDRRIGGLGGLVAAGPGTHLDELLAILGAENALAGSPVRYSTLSAEQVIALAPEVILDAAHTDDAAGARRDWNVLTSVPAVASGRVHMITNPAAIAPGPRLGEVLAELLPLIWP